MEKSIKFLIKKTAILIFIFATSLSFGQTTSVVLNNNSTGLSPGDIVSIPVVFNSTANVGTWSVVLYYNRDVLTYSSVTFNLAWTGLAPGVNSNYTLPPTSPQYPNQLATKISWLTLSGSVVCSNMTAFTINFVYNGGSTSVDVINKSTTTAQSQAHFSYLKNPTTINVGTTWTNASAAGNLATITSVAGGGNWSAGASWDLGHKPNTSNGNVIINSTSALVVDEDVNVNGDLTINSGAALTVATSKTLALTGNFLIKSDATGTGSFINNGTYAGTATIERYLTPWTSPATADGWHLISSPVAAQVVGPNFASAADASGDFFSLDEATDFWIDVRPNANSTNFEVGKGYLVAYSPTTTLSHTFAGSFNSGNVPLVLSNASAGYNLVGNPYPSGLSVSDFATWTKTNVDNYVMVWDNASSDYLTWDGTLNEVIPAMQGFLVKASASGSASITIPYSEIVHSTANVYKSTPADVLKMMVSSPNNSKSELLVKFRSNTTDAFDVAFDAPKIESMVATSTQLYTMVGQKKLAINSMGELTTASIPMGFEPKVNGTFTLKASELNSFATGTVITLQDLKTGTFQNLVQSNTYSFTATTADNVNRFVLHFNTAVGVDENNNVTSKIYSYGNDIYVNSTDAIKQVSIYNTIGQLIYTVNNPQGSFKYSLNGNSTGYYIVKVITDKNVNSEKVFVK